MFPPSIPPSSSFHPSLDILRLFVASLFAQLPLIFVLIAGIHAEQNIHSSGSLLARLSPIAEMGWQFFSIICGLLATVVNIYCINQLTPTAENRDKRSWLLSKWWKRKGEEGRCLSCSSSIQDLQLENMSRETPVPGRVSMFVEHLGSEVVHPIGVLNPNAGLPRPPPQDPPSYDDIERDLRLSEDGVARAGNPRSIFTRAQVNQTSDRNADPSPRSSNRRARKYLWRSCTYALFILSLFPLLLSFFIKPLTRDSVYNHACNGYTWEIILDAKDGLDISPSGASHLPTAKFTNLSTNLTHFEMEMSLDPPKPPSPRTHPIKRGTRTRDRFKTPGVLRRNHDRYFYLIASSALSRSVAGILSLITYDTVHHVYYSVGAAEDYRTEPRYIFPRLGLRQAFLEQQDYFGFPRVVMYSGGEKKVVTARTERGSCARMKVCARGGEVEVAVAVGPVVLAFLEGAGKCERGVGG